MTETCCPGWSYHSPKRHDPGCPWAADTWQRVALRLIDALMEWWEKRVAVGK